MSLNKIYKDIVEKTGGLIGVETKVPINDSYSLSLVYTPGVGKCCIEVKDDIKKSFELCNRGNTMALVVVKNTGEKEILSHLPEVEILVSFYKEIADFDVIPLLVKSDNENEIVKILNNIQPSCSLIEVIADDDLSKNIQKIFNNNEIPVLFPEQFEDLSESFNRLPDFNKIDFSIIKASFLKALISLKLYEFKNNLKEILKDFPVSLINEKNNPLLSYAENLFLTSYNYFLNVLSKNSKIDINDLVKQHETKFFIGEKANFKMSSENYFIDKHTVEENAIELHKRAKGVISLNQKANLNFSENYKTLLTTDFTKEISDEIIKNPEKAYNYTSKNNLILIVSDGTAVLGYGDTGAASSLPVLEGKSALLKKLGGVDAIPIALSTQNPDEIIEIVKAISPSFGGIHLEDISGPRCFEIENRLIQELDIPVFHDDQHGTAIIVLAGVINALKVAGKKINDIKIVMTGAGAAALSVTELLLHYGATNITLCDLFGPIYKGRKKGMNPYLEAIAEKTNPANFKGTLSELMRGADLFIGLSAAKVLTPEMVKKMNNRSCVFALANPTPEIMPDLAKEAGAYIVATGRSDFQNQINNSLAFPGVFRGALDVRAKCINKEMKVNAAKAIASLIPEDKLKPDFIIPNALDLRVAPAVAKAIAESAIKTKVSRINKNPDLIYESLRNYYIEGYLRKI